MNYLKAKEDEQIINGKIFKRVVVAFRRLSINNNLNKLNQQNSVYGTLTLNANKYFPKNNFEFQLSRVAELLIGNGEIGSPLRVINSNRYWIDKQSVIIKNIFYWILI